VAEDGLVAVGAADGAAEVEARGVLLLVEGDDLELDAANTRLRLHRLIRYDPAHVLLLLAAEVASSASWCT
jgi:hypothetical protein